MRRAVLHRNIRSLHNSINGLNFPSEPLLVVLKLDLSWPEVPSSRGRYLLVIAFIEGGTGCDDGNVYFDGRAAEADAEGWVFWWV